MNKETLQNRLNELDKLIDQTMANLNAMHGARQEVKSFLDNFPEVEKPAE